MFMGSESDLILDLDSKMENGPFSIEIEGK
jgi:hypothetical protein